MALDHLEEQRGDPLRRRDRPVNRASQPDSLGCGSKIPVVWVDSADLPVRGVLCFVDADWPLIGGDFTTRGVQAVWPKKLYSQFQAEGPLTPDVITETHRNLARNLPSS